MENIKFENYNWEKLEKNSDVVTGVINNICERKNYILRKSVNLSKPIINLGIGSLDLLPPSSAIDALKNIKEKFAVPRRTKIIDAILNYDIEETIQKESVIITVTLQGYIKRGALSSVKQQKRGGKGTK